jgi:hypothetical protein
MTRDGVPYIKCFGDGAQATGTATSETSLTTASATTSSIECPACDAMTGESLDETGSVIADYD